MKRIVLPIALSLFVHLMSSYTVFAQGVGYHALRNFIPSELMSFFVTSEPIGDGG